MELKAKDLDYSVPLEKIKEYRKTKLKESVIGQPRALKALQFGTGINAKGYNIFVIGDSGTGKHSTVRKVLTRYKNRKTLKDIACVCNFTDTDSPSILYFSKGKGAEFKDAVKSFIALARKKLRLQTENKIFKSEKEEIIKFHENEETKLSDDFEARLDKDHFALTNSKDESDQGPELLPIFDGKVISFDELHDLLLGHEVREPAAELGGEIVLPVGEGPGAAEAAHGVADGAVDALLHLPRHDGAAAVVDVMALVHDEDLQAGAVVDELIAGEDAGFTAAQNGDVVGAPHGWFLLVSVRPEGDIVCRLYYRRWEREAQGGLW